MTTKRTPKRSAARSQASRKPAPKSRGSSKAKKKLLRWLGTAGVALIGIIVIGSFVITSLPPRNRGTAPTNGPGTLLADMGREHIPQVQKASANAYNSVPPTSGMHWPIWAKCGEFTQPLPNEIQVHNLEHGYINIQYNPTKLDQAGIDRLREAAKKLSSWPNFQVLAPNPDIDTAIALTSWRHLQKFDAVDETAIKAFADAYRARGPENAETGGRILGCDGSWTTGAGG